jgi:hypothetical protein
LTQNETLIVVAIVAAIPGIVNGFMIQRVHLLINSGMTARDNAMKAEGRLTERDSLKP